MAFPLHFNTGIVMPSTRMKKVKGLMYTLPQGHDRNRRGSVLFFESSFQV